MFVASNEPVPSPNPRLRTKRLRASMINHATKDAQEQIQWIPDRRVLKSGQGRSS